MFRIWSSFSHWVKFMCNEYFVFTRTDQWNKLSSALGHDLPNDLVASIEMGGNQCRVICPYPPARFFATTQLDPKQLIVDSGIRSE